MEPIGSFVNIQPETAFLKRPHHVPFTIELYFFGIHVQIRHNNDDHSTAHVWSAA